MSELFVDKDGNHYGPKEIYSVLKNIGVSDCEALFIHSDIMFGSIAKGIRRKEYLNGIYDVLKELNIRYLLIPTFTYSFCNHEDYNVKTSPTSMGAFNEHLRKQDGRYRTMDPLLSISVPLELKERFLGLSEHSLGENSGLDRLHHMDGVKFLFLGARLGGCFTYVHYVEKMLEVPYRFDMPFTGNIIDESGCQTEVTQYMHTACFGVRPAEYYYFEDYLETEGFLKKQRLGDKTAACIAEKDAYREIKKMIEKDINYFLEVPFQESDLVHKYTKGLNGERVTHC